MNKIIIPIMSAFLLAPGVFPGATVVGNYSDVAYAAGCGGGSGLESGLSSMMGHLLSGGDRNAPTPRSPAESPGSRTIAPPAPVLHTSPPNPPTSRLTVEPTRPIHYARVAKTPVLSRKGKSSAKSARAKSSEKRAHAIALRKLDPPTVYWKDEMKLRYVPGGKTAVPVGQTGSKPTATVAVKSFYMDETPVTNLQYVDFLNAVLPRLQVKNGVVWSKGQIWLLLGAVKQGYRPIVFKDGKFVISSSEHTACPVLRVTAYGAAAYAAYYGKRLPTEAEWFHALEAGGGAPQHLPIPSPVMLYRRDSLGLRALTSNMGEWTVQPAATTHSQNSEQAPDYLILRDAAGHAGQKTRLAPGIQRYPWEAFADVGFRCVLPTSKSAS